MMMMIGFRWIDYCFVFKCAFHVFLVRMPCPTIVSTMTVKIQSAVVNRFQLVAFSSVFFLFFVFVFVLCGEIEMLQTAEGRILLRNGTCEWSKPARELRFFKGN